MTRFSVPFSLLSPPPLVLQGGRVRVRGTSSFLQNLPRAWMLFLSPKKRPLTLTLPPEYQGEGIRKPFTLALLLLSGLTILGCDKATKTETPTVAPTPTTAASPEAPLAIGSIRGKVVFSGQPPVPRSIDNHSCGPNAKPIVEESIVVNANGTLKNVVVYLKEVPGDTAASEVVPVIDQVDCHYVPHVIAITAGQKVAFKSSDSTLHNVHLMGAGANEGNFGMPGPGLSPPRKFADVEFTRVKCDVHPWMNCWVAVMDGPYFSVTGDQGEFEIKNVPAGSYTLNAWHEKLEPMTQSITVTADVPAQVTFTVKAP